jgi:hypothetical protein
LPYFFAGWSCTYNLALFYAPTDLQSELAFTCTLRQVSCTRVYAPVTELVSSWSSLLLPVQATAVRAVPPQK